MFEHIIVPLDGSELSETALPAAAFFVRVIGSRITLVHIIEKDVTSSVHGTRHLTNESEAEEYLKGIERAAFPSNAAVTTHVHTALEQDVAHGIVEHEKELAHNLVIMCTHGRHGLRRILLGSIAQQVVASGRVPVLLIRPDPSRNEREFGCTTLLVPLDGNPAHERGLEVALDLAAASGARVRLLSVVPTWGKLAGRHATTGRFMPSTTGAVLGLATDQLREYQNMLMKRAGQRRVEASGEVCSGDAVSIVVQRAEDMGASMIVLGTHGKKGAEAFWAQSMGARVQARTLRPLLLIPVLESQAS